MTRYRSLLFVATAMLASLPCSAMAQAAQNGAETGSNVAIEEIVVTAQFRDQKLQDVPIAITAISGDTLLARSQNNIADIANQAPSVTLRPIGSAQGPSIAATIRGLGQNDSSAAFEPGVGIYVDDVYYPRLTGANFDLLDVDRVEILRGPQGTLTGRNSEGGAIKFVSKRPDGTNDGYVQATYGSRNRINLRAAADFTLADNLYGRISGSFADQKGYIKNIDYGCSHPGSGVPARKAGTNCEDPAFGSVGYKAIRGMLRFNPSDRLDVLVSADYVRDSTTPPAEVLLSANNTNPNTFAAPGIPFDSRFICGKRCNYSSNGQPAANFIAGAIPPLDGLPLGATNAAKRSDYEGYGFSGNIDFSLTDAMKLTSITAYRAFNTQFADDKDLSPENNSFGENDIDTKFFSQELRLNAKISSAIDLTLGGYYSNEKTLIGTVQDIRSVAIDTPGGPLPLFPLQFVGDDPVRTKSKAAFATVIVRPTDQLSITGGIRYTKESKSYTFYRYNFEGVTINPFVDPVGAAYGIGYNGPDTLNLFGARGTTTDVVAALSGNTARYRGNRFDYRLSVDYRFSPAILAYATVSTGFKGGGVGPRPFNAAQAVPFDPETLTAYEIGLKTDLLNRRVRLNLSAYFNKFKGAQLVVTSCPQYGGPGPCALPENAGNADVKGVEAELTLRPVAHFQIDGAFSYLDWNWKCVVPAVVNPAATITTCSSDPAFVSQLSSPPPAVAKTQWSLGAQYEADLGEAGTLTPRVDVTHQGRVAVLTAIAAPTIPSGQFSTVGAYTLVNARLSWRNATKDLNISLEVTNLLNKYYFLNKFDISNSGTGAITGIVGRPREWAVTVRKNF